MYADQVQASAPPLAGRTPSPATHRFLSCALSRSLEDDSNKYAQTAFAFLQRVASMLGALM